MSWRRSRWIAAGAILLVLLTSKPAAAASPTPPDASPLAGLPIVRIVFQRNNIFDTSEPATSGWLYRSANALHVVSREHFLRQMILFKVGDLYSPGKAAESARLLRGLGYLNPVYITARRVEGGVEVTVTTHDRWTLDFGLNAGISGSRGGYSVQLEEKNLLGWGKMVEVEYRSDVERKTWRYHYVDPNILGSRWRADILHEDLTDGYRDLVRVERPFFSLASQRAWGGDWESGRLIDHLYSMSESVLRGHHTSHRWSAWYGIHLGTAHGTTRRLSLGWQYRHDRFDDWAQAPGLPFYPPPEDRLVSGPRLAYEQIRDNYLVLTGVRGWTGQEDVALGPILDLGLTVSTPPTGGDEERALVDGSLSVGWQRGGWLVLSEAFASGRLDRGDPHNWVVGGQVAAFRVGDRGWQLRLRSELSHDLDRNRQLTLGADTGLRGWDPDSFDGTGRAVLNVQWRKLVKRDVLHLMSLGVVGFADAGVTWNPRVGRSTRGVRTDVGIGIVADIVTSGITHLLRLDMAVPDDGSGYTVVVTSQALF
jgi:hypothetical protein